MYSGLVAYVPQMDLVYHAGPHDEYKTSGRSTVSPTSSLLFFFSILPTNSMQDFFFFFLDFHSRFPPRWKPLHCGGNETYCENLGTRQITCRLWATVKDASCTLTWSDQRFHVFVFTSGHLSLYNSQEHSIA